MKPIIIIVIIAVIIIIATGTIMTLVSMEKMVSDIDDETQSLPDTLSGIENKLDEVNQAIEQIENANPELRQIDDFTLCVYNSSKGSQYYNDMYANDSEYKEWFDNRFPDTTINQVLDNIKDRKQFYEKLGKVCGD